MISSCDADASGSEVATLVVFTRHGQVRLCQHHWAVHELDLISEGYVTLPILH